MCNRSGGKGSHWPSEEEESQGFGFVDLCEDDWQTHYQILPDGKLEPLTKKAVYTIETLLLNTDGYVEHRKDILARGGSLFGRSH
jgi:hypothetical protein